MFRIRRVLDDIIPVNRDAIIQVQQMTRAQFPDIRETEVKKIPDMLRNSLKYGFQTILLIAEGEARKIMGFALLLYDPVLRYAYLDFIAAGLPLTGRGLGSILYERIRKESLELGAKGLFFECLPDDPILSRNEDIRKQNESRLRFYERYGARPIINTLYETPLTEEGDNPPYLVFDPLGQETPLRKNRARLIVRSILEKKYPDVCTPEYTAMVVSSFKDDPIRIRPPRYIKEFAKTDVPGEIPEDEKIILVINSGHEIHHVRERGYVESPVRISAILKEIENTGLFTTRKARHFGRSWVTSVHDKDFINYLEKICLGFDGDRSVYPYVFPIRNNARPPKELSVRAGYYCIDTFTPLNRNAYLAARNAVDCTLTCAQSLLSGTHLAYSLVRPPGHHAERRSFGGFCYLNSVAIAAQYLSGKGRVAIVDLDYHHGNGQQNIFYKRADVFTISIHGHPSFAYPYFSGFNDEKGLLEGEGFNLNIPLGEQVSGEIYREALKKALKRVKEYDPDFLLIALGLDISRKDPTGTWDLSAKDFFLNGKMVGKLNRPTLVVQEGGYNTRVLGQNARNFFTGLWQGAYRD